MNERLTVEDLMAEAKQFFQLAIDNLEHDRVLCDRRECQSTISEQEAKDHVIIAVSGDQGGGISAIRLHVVCRTCRQQMQWDGHVEQVNPKAPVYDELLP